jgi:cobalt-zinc-cadmium efflux system protein
MSGEHNHDHHQITNQNERTLYIATCITIFFMVIELIGGIFSKSLILIADAGHMLIDASALILALFAMRIAKKSADAKRSYGYKRGQVIAAFINSITLLATTIWIVIESVKRLMHPEPVLGKIVVILAIVGVLINGFTAYLLNKSSKNDINIKSALIHVVGDLLGYVAAIVTGIVVLYTGWMQIDPILSLIFALLMIRSAWAIAKDSIHILMEGTPKEVDKDKIVELLKGNIPAIIDVHHVHIWSLTTDSLILTAHIRIGNLNNSNEVLKATKKLLKEQFNIAHVTIELEDRECSEEDEHDMATINYKGYKPECKDK